MRWKRYLAGGTLALALFGPAGGAMAGDAELAVLQSFMGSYNGKVILIEPDKRSEFDCRLTISKGNRGKVVFNAKCPLVAGNGAVGYNDAAGRYEIAITTSADFSAAAAGTVEGDGVKFTVNHHDTNKKGETLDMNARITFNGAAVLIGFDANFDGKPWTGSLNFARSGG